MSDVIVMRHLLVESGPLIAVIPANKIFAGQIPQNTPLPAIAINSISNVEQKKVQDHGDWVLMTSRTQVTVVANSYVQQKALIQLIGLAVKGGPRVVAGIPVKNVLRDIVGPDQRDDAVGMFIQTRDFRVIYNEPL
jgi:hypothetical protein